MGDQDVDSMIRRVSNWGRWGADDEVGTVNYITPKVRAEAAACIRTGKAFSLAIPFNIDGPHPPLDRRLNPRHAMLQTGTDLKAGMQQGAVDGFGYSDDMITMALQSVTQWDGLSHAFYDYKMYNDRDCTLVGSEGAEKNSIDKLANRVVTRAVLLDMPRALGVATLEPGYAITADDFEHALEIEQVEIRSGDILLIRTGHMAAIRASGSWAGYAYAPEPGPGLSVLPWFQEKQIAGAATDTWAFEVIPGGASIFFPIHAAGIVHMGLLIGEIFALDALAADCAEDGVYECFLSAQPLPFTKAVASPINPIAIK